MQIFQKDHFGNEQLEAIQSNVASIDSGFRNHPLLKGKLLESVAVSTTAIKLQHKLQRAPKGYFVVKSNANITVHDTGVDKQYINLVASGTAIVSLWVF